jgi:tetratricopeptide (TPR) repeat protein
MASSRLSSSRFVAGPIVFLVVSAFWLYAFPAASIVYVAVVLAHVALGVIAAFLLVPRLLASQRNRESMMSRAGWLLMCVGAVLGIALVFTGTPHSEYKLLYSHIAAAAVASILIFANCLRIRGSISTKPGLVAVTFALVLATVGLAYGARYLRVSRWEATNRIANPKLPPETMNGEGDGPSGHFFPSSAQTKHKGYIPPNYFTESQACERCHQDIYKQWQSSMHHFSSFNNQWYRKSIEYMQDTIGVRPSKWCSGCHDPALLYSGLFDTPIKQLGVDRPESQAGLGCMMCHSIVEVKSTMGQGDFFLEYPKLHELAASKNPAVRWVHDYLTKLNPEPHRRVFLKPFMREQTPEFCASCHKVHLDVPVNSYRWIRGFNEYDNWQASGVSGQGARSFYYPPKPQQCADCHMPMERSNDFGNVNGFVHSHRFPGANTAVPYANRDQQQLELSERFLKDSVTVDIFAITPAKVANAATVGQPEVNTTFAVGEEAESSAPSGSSEGETAFVTAPLNRVNASIRRGDDARVDVVVRTKRVGHFFPGGTIDAYDTWVELKATDDKGQVLFWSGKVEDNGRGPVEKGAHFYRSLQIDAHGNPINKRNAWATRAVVYVRLIPPGAADTVHFRLHVPENAGNRIKLEARLNYRKFAWWNTQFSFAGVYDEQQKAAKYTADFDDRIHSFTGNTQLVSAAVKEIPNIPIMVMSSSEAILNVLDRKARAPEPQVVLNKEDWTRWNDYGIGLFLQGDLKGAQQAFAKITEIDPKNADGWVNLGRVAVQEGDMDRARVVLEKALALDPNLARTNFFYAKVLRNDGNYDEALRRLRMVLDQYPNDRVVRNEAGRVLFLQRKFPEAIKELRQTLAIDPEDLQAHYNLMLCYQGMGNEQQAQVHRKLYMRFKADESSQAITGEYRQKHPEDNNERQAVHEHGNAVPKMPPVRVAARRGKAPVASARGAESPHGGE